MSLGGLVAYGDSDDSDINEEEDEPDKFEGSTEKRRQAETEPEEVVNAETPAQVAAVPSQANQQSKESDNKTDDIPHNNERKVFPNIGTVDDIEDDEFEPQTRVNLNTVETPTQRNVFTTTSSSSSSGQFGLKLPPPKLVDQSEEAMGPLAAINRTPRSLNTPIAEKSVLDESDVTDTTSTSILAGLPAPKPVNSKTNELDIEEDEIEDEIKEKASKLAALAKPPPKPAKRQPVKISVPSLEDYDSDEDDKPVKKKPKTSSLSGKSGLFALLPEPKNISVKKTNRPLIPYTLTKKPAQATPTPKSVPKKKKVPTATLR